MKSPFSSLPPWCFYLPGVLLSLLAYVLLEGCDLVGRGATALYAVNLAALLLLFSAYGVLLRLLRSARLKALIWGAFLLAQTLLYCTALYAQAPKYALLLTLLLAPLTYPKSSQR